MAPAPYAAKHSIAPVFRIKTDRWRHCTSPAKIYNFFILHHRRWQGLLKCIRRKKQYLCPNAAWKKTSREYNITVGKFDNNRGMNLATRSHWNRAGSFTQHSVRTQRTGAVTGCTQTPQYVSMRAALWWHFADKAVLDKISNTDNVEAQISRSPRTSNYHLQSTKLKGERRLTRWLTVISFRWKKNGQVQRSHSFGLATD